MAIEVTCPNGHGLKIKEKYAGKSGLCPRCKAQIWVPKPAVVESDEVEEFIDLVPRSPSDAPCERPVAAARAPLPIDNSDALAGDDDPPPGASGVAHSAGESLLSSAVIRHQKVCPRCYEVAPIWYARCKHCDYYFTN